MMRARIGQVHGSPRLRRILVAMAALTLSSGAGAVTTIDTIVNGDHLACRQFLAMVKMAGIPEMSDAQLCDFRFARLPPSKLEHFTALHWEPLEVTDPVALYQRMRMDNVVKGFVRSLQPPWPNLLKATGEAAADHNLGFYTTQVQLQGKGPMVTVVKMDVIRGCVQLPKYLHVMGIPFYALYKGPKLKHPLHVAPAPDGRQMLLWESKGLHIPVLMEVLPYWSSPDKLDRPVAYFNQMTMNSLVPSRLPEGTVHDVIYSYGTCQYNLWSKTEPVGTPASLKGPNP